MQIHPAFAQDSIHVDAIADIRRIDSIVAAIDMATLTEKKVIGSSKTFHNYKGIAFLNEGRTEIRKVELRLEATGEIITYYCNNNVLQLIVTSQALYFKKNGNYFVFHSISDKGLLTQEDLEMQDEMIMNYVGLILKE